MICFNCHQDGHLARDCQWTPEIEDRKLPQFARCGSCGAVVYTWERNAPCDKHRTVAGWRAYYHSPDFIADVAEAQQRAGERQAPRDEAALRELAARQVAEFRAGSAIPWSLPADTVDAGNPRPQGDQLAPPAGPPVT